MNWTKYQNCLLVGPCSLGEGGMAKVDMKSTGASIGGMMKMCTTDDHMNGSQILLDAFSYHYYNNISERLGSIMPGMR